MEKFKIHLKKAMEKQAFVLKLRGGEAASIFSTSGSETLPSGPIENQWLNETLKTLFPNKTENLVRGLPVKGKLSIGSGEELRTIGIQGARPSLAVYFPPHGLPMFESDWAASQGGNRAAGTIPISAEENFVPGNQPPPANPLRTIDEAPPENLFAIGPASAPSVKSEPTSHMVPPPPPGPAGEGAFGLGFSPIGEEVQLTPPADLADPAIPAPDSEADSVAASGDFAFPKLTDSFTDQNPFEAAREADTPDFLGSSVDLVEPLAAPATPAAPAPALLNEQGSMGEVQISYGAAIPGSTIDMSRSYPIDEVLKFMIAQGASDLHLTMDEPLVLRVDGEIVRHPKWTMNESLMKSFIDPIMPPVNKVEFFNCNDTDFAYEVPGLARFRVNVFRDRLGVGAVLRQIPATVLSADQLGLSEAIRKFCTLHKGLVLVTGPTGSGKSTTLAAMIDLINQSRTDHILTIEDPVEFVHQQKKCLINQREVHRHTESFSRALRAALREDPDIVLIGEMRDLETVAIAIETAETGHLVFGTLHTNTAISTVDRIVDQFPSDQQEQIRVMLAESLKGVVSQTLCKKIGGGRAAAHEILVVNKAVSAMLREGKTHMIANHMQTQKAEGNMLLNEALFKLVQDKTISAIEGLSRSIDRENFSTMLKQAGISLHSRVS